jgi:hypothetical protein
VNDDNCQHPTQYGAIVLDTDAIDYAEVDPPLRRLIPLMNSQLWVKTYGCCAGHAHHGENPGPEHRFFIGLFVPAQNSEVNKLRVWLEEANRLNGPTGLRAEVEYVHKHALGQGNVDGWCAYRVVVIEMEGRDVSSKEQPFKRMIRSLEMAWEALWPRPKKKVPRQSRVNDSIVPRDR